MKKIQWSCPHLCHGQAHHTRKSMAYPVIFHCTVSMAGPIEEHIACFFIKPESKGWLFWPQGCLDGLLVEQKWLSKVEKRLSGVLWDKQGEDLEPGQNPRNPSLCVVLAFTHEVGQKTQMWPIWKSRVGGGHSSGRIWGALSSAQINSLFQELNIYCNMFQESH